MNQASFFIAPEMTMHLEESIVFFSKQKQEVLQALPGNPYGVQIRSFGVLTKNSRPIFVWSQ